jgi:hypothetical protein
MESNPKYTMNMGDYAYLMQKRHESLFGNQYDSSLGSREPQMATKAPTKAQKRISKMGMGIKITVYGGLILWAAIELIKFTIQLIIHLILG